MFKRRLFDEAWRSKSSRNVRRIDRTTQYDQKIVFCSKMYNCTMYLLMNFSFPVYIEAIDDENTIANLDLQANIFNIKVSYIDCNSLKRYANIKCRKVQLFIKLQGTCWMFAILYRKFR